MIVAAALALGSAWFLGVLSVGAAWPRTRSLASDWALILPLGVGLGLGVTSMLFFAASLLSDEPFAVTMALELSFTLVAGACLWWRRRGVNPELVRGGPGDFWLSAVFGTMFVQAAIAAVLMAVRAYQAQPYSNSDG